LFIFSNLATSLDGKIATSSRAPFYLGTPADRAQMQVLRKRADVLIMGASTLRAYKKFCGVLKAKPERQIANAILSSNLGGINPDFPFFSDPALKRFLFVTQATRGTAAASKLKKFESSCEIIVLKKSPSLAHQIVTHLSRQGFKKLLVEGGGGLMWEFASQNLIDEYNVTLTPKIVGGENAPTLVEGNGFSPDQILGLKLARCKKLGDELYLTYKKSKARS
jgi:riboflavin-specific deaminase-like protein